VEVAVLGLKELPAQFWSRANRRKQAEIELPIDPARVERAELHTTTWAGGPGKVKDYFTLNGRHFPVAEGGRSPDLLHGAARRTGACSGAGPTPSRSCPTPNTMASRS
jgi:hypothetical protein